MTPKKLHAGSLFAPPALIALSSLLFWLATPARAQFTATQDNDTTRGELARFDQFLDSHREIAEQLQKNPSLVNDKDFVKNHPVLQSYLQDHPGIRGEIAENPSAFMRQEDRYDRGEDRRDNDIARGELTQFDKFLDSHGEIAEQLRRNPSLVDDKEFVRSHPALQSYLQEHPGVREQITQNPNAFMQAENTFDRRESTRDRDDNLDRDERARFDRFLDGHREIGEQIRKNPSLVNDKDFARNHPELQAYLRDNPGIREAARENPNAFMREDESSNRRAFTGEDRDMTRDRDRSASFREFLGSHSDLAQQLSRDPSLAKDRKFVESHPEFQDYLKSHPDVNQELTKDPHRFVKLAQPVSNTGQGNQGTKTPTYDPKANH